MCYALRHTLCVDGTKAEELIKVCEGQVLRVQGRQHASTNTALGCIQCAVQRGLRTVCCTKGFAGQAASTHRHRTGLRTVCCTKGFTALDCIQCAVQRGLRGWAAGLVWARAVRICHDILHCAALNAFRLHIYTRILYVQNRPEGTCGEPE